MSSSTTVEDDLCTVCNNRKINCIFLECGHMLTCYECGKPMTKCSVCQKDLKDCVNMDELNEDEPDIPEEMKGLGRLGISWMNAPMPINQPNSSKKVQKPKEDITMLSDILSEDLIPKLSNRQLKSLLKGEGKNICEKNELIVEVKARWSDMMKNAINEQSSSQDEEAEDLCHICKKEKVDCMFSECGHMVSCFSCGRKVDQCPICQFTHPQVVSMRELYNKMIAEDQQEFSENEEEDFIWHEGVCRDCGIKGIDYIFPECGHMVLCKDCKEKNKVCPICQQIKCSA